MAVLTVRTCIANLEILITFGGVAVSASDKMYWVAYFQVNNASLCSITHR
jgi:molybdopterin biosynthesis enzyme